MGLMSFFGRDARRPQHEVLESIVGPTASLTGHLRSDGGVRIDGIFEGVIEVAGNVVIGESAKVVANITARNITVGGAVRGNIDATGRLEILSHGQVLGDIMVGQVMIDDGGVFQGNSRIRGIDQRALQAPAEHVAFPEVVIEPVSEPEARQGTSSANGVTAGPSSAGPTPSPSPAVTVEGSSRPAAEEVEEEIYELADDIEPIIPDVVIEDVPPERPPTSSRRRSSRTGGRR